MSRVERAQQVFEAMHVPADPQLSRLKQAATPAISGRKFFVTRLSNKSEVMKGQHKTTA